VPPQSTAISITYNQVKKANGKGARFIAPLKDDKPYQATNWVTSERPRTNTWLIVNTRSRWLKQNGSKGCSLIAHTCAGSAPAPKTKRCVLSFRKIIMPKTDSGLYRPGRQHKALCSSPDTVNVALRFFVPDDSYPDPQKTNYR